MNIKTVLDFGKDCFTFELKVTTDLANFNVLIAEPYMFEFNKWQELINIIENGGKILMDFYQGNGEGYLSCDNDTLEFVAMPSGAGGDVRVGINFNLVNCRAEVLAAFIEIFNDPKVREFYKVL